MRKMSKKTKTLHILLKNQQNGTTENPCYN